MPDDINIRIKTTFSGQGTKAAADAVAKTGKASEKAAQQAAKAAQAAERSMLQQAQAAARLQAATGNLASAQSTLQKAIGKSASSSKAALSAQTQLVQLQNKGAKAAQQSADSTLKLAQAQARAHAAAGNLAQAESILAEAIAKSGASARASLGAQVQLLDVQKKIAGAKPPDASLFSGWTNAAKGAVGALGAVAIALAGLNSVADGLHVAADYESQMAILQANTGASADVMAAAGEKAKQLGADLTLPATSAGSAAQAMNELVKGGLQLDQAMAAAKGTLQLAAAGAIAEAEAAQIATGALNAFQLKGAAATMVADQLAAGAAATSTSVKLMGDSLEQGGGLFASYQVRVVGGTEALTQFNTAVGVLATRGVTGQKAGTYIASAMERIANPTDAASDLMQDLAQKIGITGDIAYDAQGRMRPFEEIMHNVAAATADMSNKQRDATIATLFMTEGSKAVIPILDAMTGAQKDSAIGWDAIKAATTEAGAAQTQAAAQMAGLNGAVAGLQSQIETLALSAFEPLLPLMTGVVAGMAEFAGQLNGPVSAGATMLASTITNLGAFIQTVAIPAMVGATAATIAYGFANSATLIPALTASLAQIAAQTAALYANAAAAAAAALPYAMIAAAVGGVALAYNDLQTKLDGATNAALNNQQWWTDSAVALENYKNAQIEGNVAISAAANTVDILRNKIQEETKALAEREVAGNISDAQRAQAFALIQQHAAGLQQATDNLNNLTNAEMQEAAASLNATGALSSAQAGLAGMGEQAQLTAEDLDKLADELTKIYEKGGAAVADYVATEMEFQSGMVSRQEEFSAKMAELQTQLGAAKTEASRAAIQEEIAALQAGYAQQEQTQAESYARQQAAQNAALGQMLLNYTATQVTMGNIGAEQGEAIANAITEKFGIVGDNSQATFLQMAADIDNWAASGTGDAAQLANALAGTRDQAVSTATQMQALERQYVAEVLTTMAGKPPEEIAAALRAIPARVYAEVIINERYNATSGGTAGRQEWEREMRPRRGGGSASAGGGRFLTQGPTTLTVGDNPGGVEMVEVTPLSGKGSTRVGPGMARLAGGGTVVASGLTNTPTSGGTRRARGGSGAVSDVQKAAEQMTKIQQDAIDKMTELATTTAAKLAEMDVKYAEQQAESRASLYADMASDYADMLADMEADDLDFFKRGADKKQLQEREAQQAQYRERISQAQNEAREIAKTDAQLAKDTLSIREEAAQARMRLDDDYNKTLAETPKKQRKALKEQYDQAVAAQEQATQTKLDIAQEEARQREQDRQSEKAEVVADSQERRAEIINDAVQQAAEVEGATNAQRQAVVLSLAAQSDAATGWASAWKRATDQVVSDASRATSAINGIPGAPSSTAGGTGAPGGTAAAGGGTFVSSGPTTLTVGDNPGGRELVSVVPLSGKGSTRVGPGMARMAGGGSILAGGGNDIDLSMLDPGDVEAALQRLAVINQLIDQYARQNKVDPGQAKKYADTVDIVAKALTATVEIRRLMKDTGQPLDMERIRALIDEATTIGTFFVQLNLRKENNIGLLKEYGEGIAAAFDVIHGILEMRRELKDIPPATDLNIIMMLADETRQVIRVVQFQLVKLFQEEREQLAEAGEAIEQATSILNSVIDLRNNLKDLGPPILQQTVLALADEAMATLQTLRTLQGLSVDEANGLAAVAEQTDHAISILSGMADLREKVADPAPPLTAAMMERLANEARMARDAILAAIPDSSANAAGLEAYAANVEQAVGILQNLADLRGSLTDVASPLDLSVVDRLAGEARRIVERVYRDVIPYTAEQVQGMEAYASVNEQSVAILGRMSELAKTLGEPTIPIDEKLVDYLSAMARRVAIRLFADTIPYTEQQADGFQRYADVLSNSVDILTKIAGLGEGISKRSPLDEKDVRELAAQAYRVAGIVIDELIPIAEEEANAFQRYAGAVGNAVDIVSRIAGLGADIEDAQPFTLADVARWSARAQQVYSIVKNSAMKIAEETADEFGRWADVVGNSVSVVADVAGLGASFKDAQPFTLEDVKRAAANGKRIVQIVEGEMLPITEEQATALQRWGDAQGAAVSGLQATLGLTASLFAEYVSPSDAQLDRIVTDADRIISRVKMAATAYGTEGLDAAKAYSEALGGTVASLTDTAKFVEALRSGNEFAIDPEVVAKLEESASVVIGLGGRLGAQAATIPASDISALANVTSALTGVYESLIKLAAVPVGDLAGASGALAGLSLGGFGGGGGSSVVNNYTIAPGAIVVYGALGQDATAIANQVIAQLETRTNARRY